MSVRCVALVGKRSMMVRIVVATPRLADARSPTFLRSSAQRCCCTSARLASTESVCFPNQHEPVKFTSRRACLGPKSCRNLLDRGAANSCFRGFNASRDHVVASNLTPHLLRPYKRNAASRAWRGTGDGSASDALPRHHRRNSRRTFEKWISLTARRASVLDRTCKFGCKDREHHRERGGKGKGKGQAEQVVQKR